MKILLFGGSGQLGFEIRTRAHDLNFEVLSPVHSEVDIGERAQVQHFVANLQVDVVINCAAYTAVDKAEKEREQALRINRDGALHAAEAAKAHGVRLLHVSTDYVYAGDTRTLITESEPVRPLNYYGESKLAGEIAVQELLGADATILRTSSLHGQKGINFVNTMLKFFAERPVVSVVNDQFMCPTWAGWLAEVLLDLVRIPTQGVLHACGEGVVSWFDFARAIHEMSIVQATNERSRAVIEPISAAAFNRPANRPAYSGMDCGKLTQILGRAPISWQKGLKRHLQELGVFAQTEVTG